MNHASSAANRCRKILRKIWVSLSIAAAISSVCGCAPKNRSPSFSVQLCVVDDQGLSTFKNVMLGISKSENMSFIDGSNDTLQAYKIFQENNNSFVFSRPVTHFGIKKNDQFLLIVGNINSQSYNMVIGFESGYEKDDTEAYKFTQRVVDALKQHWSVKAVPEGKGAFPMEDCPNRPPG